MLFGLDRLTRVHMLRLFGISIFMLRFMMLGSNINKKYQNTSLLLTEQVRRSL